MTVGRVACVALVFLALGCTERTPEESAAPATCVFSYVTLHYVGEGDQARLFDELGRAGFVWRFSGEGLAQLDTPDPDVRGTLSIDAGPATDLVLSFEASAPGVSSARVHLVADKAAGAVALAWPQATLERRLADAHTASC